LAIAFIPGMPRVSVEPDLILVVFLPPLLYEAAMHIAWPEFWKWRRSISMLAFGLVFFTSVGVAYFTSAVVPGFTLAMGFLLGGIISPPDAVAATSVLKSVKIPRRGTIILEGESLINDASSLIVYRFALAAILTGSFSFGAAVEDFFAAAVGGVVVGVALGNILYVLHRFLPTTPSIDTSITLMTPYIAYLSAEEFHFSGVMAVVACGLFLSFRAHDFMDYRSRMQTNATWSTLGYILNGVVFVLIGLELPVVLEGLSREAVMAGIRYGTWISLLVIALRFLWMYPAAHLPRWLSPRIRRKEPSPGWRLPTMLSWAGMRGVISLAMALALPISLPNGEPFPERATIILITFVVILITLVLQGITLPFVVHWLKLEEVDPRLNPEEQKLALRHQLAQAALERLNRADVPRDELMERLRANYRRVLDSTATGLQELHGEGLPTQPAELDELEKYQLAAIAAQREALTLARKENIFDIELIRKQEARLDHEEARAEH
jgi:CPA1 family monovalent cation:H+ antiporter